jgi:hypothetical protein
MGSHEIDKLYYEYKYMQQHFKVFVNIGLTIAYADLN